MLLGNVRARAVVDAQTRVMHNTRAHNGQAARSENLPRAYQAH